MREMADGDFPLEVNVRQERSLVVYAKGEDTVLIWQFEGGAENGAVGGGGHGLEVEAMEG